MADLLRLQTEDVYLGSHVPAEIEASYVSGALSTEDGDTEI
jgi:hypothetical protein